MRQLVSVVCIAILFSPIVGRAGDGPKSFKNAKSLADYYAASIVTAKDLDKDTREYLQSQAKNQSPGLVLLDLDGDGRQDAALLVKGPNPEDATLKVFMCKPKCREFFSELVGSTDSTFLEILRPGKTVSPTEALPNQPESLQLKNAGVVVTNFGKGQRVYFWNPHSRAVERVTTGD